MTTLFFAVLRKVVVSRKSKKSVSVQILDNSRTARKEVGMVTLNWKLLRLTPDECG